MNAIWHDVECAAYVADLDVWRDLAGGVAGPVLDLGCGTGRVALDLAARGHDVTGLDSDRALVEALRSRADAQGLTVATSVADVRSFELGRRFGLAISPMQVVQLLGGPDGRAKMLASVRRHLEPGGVFALAVANPFDDWSDEESLPPLPDVREQDGWVYSSTPLAVRRAGDAFVIDRRRQAVSPDGQLEEELTTITLDSLPAEALEREAAQAGFGVLPRRTVAETADYVGSDVVVLEAR